MSNPKARDNQVRIPSTDFKMTSRGLVLHSEDQSLYALRCGGGRTRCDRRPQKRMRRRLHAMVGTRDTDFTGLGSGFTRPWLLLSSLRSHSQLFGNSEPLRDHTFSRSSSSGVFAAAQSGACSDRRRLLSRSQGHGILQKPGGPYSWLESQQGTHCEASPVRSERGNHPHRSQAGENRPPSSAVSHHFL